ncbi:MAG: S41 family peptidase [Candidatus Thorarchaeota archaeon]
MKKRTDFSKLKKIPKDLSEVNEQNLSIIIEEIKQRLKSDYLFPEEVSSLCSALDLAVKNQNFSQIQTPSELVKQLTKTLQHVINDKHLRVQLPSEIHDSSIAKRPLRGIEKVEILQENIGYISIESFLPLSLCENTLLGAMQFVHDTRALILDLRKCRGGSADSANLLLSFLFPENNRLLLKTYFRPQNQEVQVWTSWTPYKYKKPIYALTSSSTFSAGEHFVFALKINKQATIIGENTGGGAHPVAVNIHEIGVAITIPIGRTFDPISGDDWEGGGISPDIECLAEEAFEKALAHIKNNIPELNHSIPLKRMVVKPR